MNFQHNTSNHITDGATALKSETDTLKQNISEQEIDESININSDIGAAETLMDDPEESLILKNEIEETKTETNGLENFGIDEIEESVPDLFNSEKPETSEHFTSFENKEESNDEDELEIPAFLRRQKS